MINTESLSCSLLSAFLLNGFMFLFLFFNLQELGMRIKSVKQVSCFDYPVRLLTSVFPAQEGILPTPKMAV